MKRNSRALIYLIGFFILSTMLIIGCDGDGGSSTTSPSSSVNVTGVWDVIDEDGDTGVMSLTQDGNTITGAMTASSNYRATISGSIDGYHITFTGAWNFFGWVNYYDGTVNSSATYMSGTSSSNYFGGNIAWSATKR